MFHRLIFILLILVATASSGCAARAARSVTTQPLPYYALPAHDPWYSIGFCNDTAEGFTDVRLEFVVDGQRYECEAGRLGGGGGGWGAGLAHAPDPIPADGEVIWTTPDGVEHRQRVAINAAVKDPRRFDGTIWIKIGKEGVIVIPVTDAESWERARKQLPAVP